MAPHSATETASSPVRLNPFHELLSWFRNVIWHIQVIYRGMQHLSSTGKNLPDVRQHMISLFCRTSGLGLDLFHFFIRMKYRPYPIAKAQGILGYLSAENLDHICDQIAKDGYYVFPKSIPESVIENLHAITREIPASPDKTANSGPVLYDATKPEAARYFYSESQLIHYPVAQSLLTDASVLAVAQRYLKCAPIIDIFSLGWSTAYPNENLADAAQMYHFDLDRLRWLKFFIYLTDVDTNTGPHCYIDGTHRPFTIPAPILAKNYSRVTDEELGQYYPADRFRELVARRGTIMAVDTRGLHKGKPLVNGHRLLWGMEFCDHLVGANFEKAKVPQQAAEAMKNAFTEYPRVYSKFEITK